VIPLEVLRANLREINSLNQRGGRMLSVVDLIEAGTLDIPTAAYLLTAVAGGASFLTAAGPGGVGKTTLLATMLSFLPPGEQIETITDPALAGEGGRRCFLCHEIGAGRWYGYLWGESAAAYFALRSRGRIAATIHAETVEEIKEQVLGPSIGAAPQDLAAIDLLAFMVRRGGLRRVSGIFEAEGAKDLAYRQVVTWEPGDDEFSVEASQPPDQLARAREFIERLVADEVYLIEDVMAAVAGFYGEHYPAR